MTDRRTARFISLVLLFFAWPALAQLLPPEAGLDFGTDFSLSITPEHPAPGDTAHITAHSTLLDLDAGTITWYMNGAKYASGRGLSEADILVGPLGSEMRIEVVLTEAGFERAAAEALIRPTEIDLLWESDSYAPPLFRGRALPSEGTTLRLEAMPHFVRANRSFVPASDIYFTWRRNDYVVKSVSGRGKSRALLESPSLFGTDTISVEARTSDGAFSGEASIRVPSTEPILTLYENHPIFGIMYHRAFGAQNLLPEVETSFVAVPYFANATRAGDSGLIYEWRVNGNRIVNDVSHPNEITIDARGSTGIARIELALSHITNLFLNSSGSWAVTFTGNAGETQGNLFESAQQ